MDPYAYVARVWHERTATWRARPKRISKNISEQQKMGADDGNRTRMTSLEGIGGGPAEQRRRRSGGIFNRRE